MKLKEIIIRFTIILPIYVVSLVPYLALCGISCLFAIIADVFANCATWLDLGLELFRDWVLVVTGIEEKESVDEL